MNRFRRGLALVLPFQLFPCSALLGRDYDKGTRAVELGLADSLRRPAFVNLVQDA